MDSLSLNVVNSFDPDKWLGSISKPYYHKSSCVLAGIIKPDNEFFLSKGTIDKDYPREPDLNTIFEIGSITKVFTSILLSRFVLEGRIDQDIPISRIRDEFAGTPDWITPRALATHTSGLPRIPMPSWQALFMSIDNPYAEFSGEDLIRWMQNYRPKYAPVRNKSSYSNLGMGLLGYLLGLVDGQGYWRALFQDVLEPLGLSDITIELREDRKKNFAVPHSVNGKVTPAWDFDALAGAGALRSSARDMSTFVRAVIEAPLLDDVLSKAIQATMDVQIKGKREFMPSQCSGWIKLAEKEGQPAVYFHNGGTAGSLCTLYICPAAKVGIFVLSNHGYSLRKDLSIMLSDPDGKVYQVLDELKDPNS